MEKKCYHCGEDIGFNSEYYTMQKAIKPPYHHRRFIDIGFVCEEKPYSYIEDYNEDTAIFYTCCGMYSVKYVITNGEISGMIAGF